MKKFFILASLSSSCLSTLCAGKVVDAMGALSPATKVLLADSAKGNAKTVTAQVLNAHPKREALQKYAQQHPDASVTDLTQHLQTLKNGQPKPDPDPFDDLGERLRKLFEEPDPNPPFNPAPEADLEPDSKNVPTKENDPNGEAYNWKNILKDHAALLQKINWNDDLADLDSAVMSLKKANPTIFPTTDRTFLFPDVADDSFTHTNNFSKLQDAFDKAKADNVSKEITAAWQDWITKTYTAEDVNQDTELQKCIQNISVLLFLQRIQQQTYLYLLAGLMNHLCQFVQESAEETPSGTEEHANLVDAGSKLQARCQMIKEELQGDPSLDPFNGLNSVHAVLTGKRLKQKVDTTHAVYMHLVSAYTKHFSSVAQNVYDKRQSRAPEKYPASGWLALSHLGAFFQISPTTFYEAFKKNPSAIKNNFKLGINLSTAEKDTSHKLLDNLLNSQEWPDMLKGLIQNALKKERPIDLDDSDWRKTVGIWQHYVPIP